MAASRSTLFAFLIATCTACGAPVNVGNFAAGGSAGTPGAGGTAGTGAAQAGAGGGAQQVFGTGTGKIAIHFQSTTAPFAHTDGLSGQTPLSDLSGIRSLRLYRSSNDPNPVTVFDFGQSTIEVNYANGADTLVYTAQVKYLPEGTYTLARVVHTYVRYRVTSTMHVNGMNLPGTFDNVQVLSDGTLLNGVVRNHGYFKYVFSTGGQSFPISGTNAPMPQWTTVGGFSVVFENGEWAYQVPINLTVDPNLNTNMTLIFRVNMNECFRWLDQAGPGYAPGVFDTTPTSFEPVKQFGANSFAISFQ